VKQATRLAAAVAALLLVGCANPSGVRLDTSVLRLPLDPRPAALATATVYTSPDGGIYRNPDRLEIVLVTARDVDVLVSRLGGAAGDWAQLRPFGDFTLVALRLRNDGKVGSDPPLADLQIASDLAPAGTDSGTVRHFFHPMYALAALSDERLGGDCSVHLDPGKTSTVVLVYPPVRRGDSVVFGRYQEFSVRAAFGGAVSLGNQLYARTCDSPRAVVG
jgi:hypothetical protein